MPESPSFQSAKDKSLPLSFYRRKNVVKIASDLIGKALFARSPQGELTGGIIIETESYRGPEDKASHAYKNRRTIRTEVMFHKGGVAYVYMCYGIHYLLNVVTHEENIPHAVLIRALFPTHGLQEMAKRRKKSMNDLALTNGPGSLCQALGVTKKHNGVVLNGSCLWIEETPITIPRALILKGPRIGIDYAEEYALLPWRFYLREVTADLQREIALWAKTVLAIPSQTG